MKILISGGHLTPALAFIDYLQKEQPEVEIVFVGRIYSQTKAKQKAHEQKEVEQRKIPFIALQAPRFAWRQLSLQQKLMLPVKLKQAVAKAKKIIEKEKPDLFLSFGGYLAFPLALAAKKKGVPIITHEQTLAAGFSNQLIAKLANKVALSWPSSKAYFPGHKVVMTGNPIREKIFDNQVKKPSWIKTELKKPVLLIMGGNQGSRFLNQTLSQILPQLTKDWTVIHQSGNPTKDHDAKKELEKVRGNLPSEQQKNYLIKEWFSTQDLAWIYPKTKLVISRSGANTIQELLSQNIPAIFIPLPFAHHQEQLKNAKFLADQGGAVVLNQTELTAQSLLAAVQQTQPQLKTMKKSLAQIKREDGAAKKIYQLILETIT